MPAFRKEVQFFNKKYTKGNNWYRAHFPTSLYITCVKKIQKRNIITGEATPAYIFHPSVPERISETMPSVRIIALLRNPVDRAFSHYNHEVRRGRESLTFEEAIYQEEARLSGEEEKLINNEKYISYNHSHYSYLSRGAYVLQLKRWLRFFPRDQILILKSEDLYIETSATMKRVYEFLSLSNIKLKNHKNYNPGEYKSMETETRKLLNEHFKPYNQSLYELLGTTFWWEN
jgi:sulfotransferase family protein